MLIEANALPLSRTTNLHPVLCQPLTRIRKTVQRSNLEERLPTLEVTGRAVLRDGRVLCRHELQLLVCVCCVRTLPFDELIQRIQAEEQSSFFTCKVVIDIMLLPGLEL